MNKELMSDFFIEVEDERGRQDTKWEFINTVTEWINLIKKQAGKMRPYHQSGSIQRQMVKVAALALATYEWAERRGW